jgi:uncharacterized protein YoxC
LTDKITVSESELIDPTGDTIAEIAKALQELNSAEEFVRFYLGDSIQNGEQRKEDE